MGHSLCSMSLDNAVCPGCQSTNVREEKSHKVLNLALGLALGAAGSDDGALIALGPVFYVLDIPFGANREYHCNACYRTWDVD